LLPAQGCNEKIYNDKSLDAREKIKEITKIDSYVHINIIIKGIIEFAGRYKERKKEKKLSD
jgi:hypothetical protein